MPSKMGRLLALTDAEFKRKRAEPQRYTFKGRSIDLRKLGKAWEKERGAAARMAAIVLREDSEGLFAKVSADPQTAATFAEAIGWLKKEAELLTKAVERHEIAASRLRSAVCRYRAAQHQQQPQQRPAETPSGWDGAAS